jgi:hypothetical protein
MWILENLCEVHGLIKLCEWELKKIFQLVSSLLITLESSVLSLCRFSQNHIKVCVNFSIWNNLEHFSFPFSTLTFL